MFVLLEHDIAASPDSPARECDIHWDLLIEEAGHEQLPTWRLARDPLEAGGEIPAERIKDHRR